MTSQLSSLSRRAWMATAAGVLAPRASAAEIVKSPSMFVHSRRPEDLEMPLQGLLNAITPLELFYVRSHHYTPQIDERTYSLKVSGEVTKPLSLSLAEIRRLPKVELTGVMECAGNGRGLYRPQVPGLQWTYGSVGNAKWVGVRLADVLKRAGIKPNAQHILFDGADVPVGKMPEFQRTIPVGKALAEETLLAYEMNGQTLPLSHGFPLRVVVPGWGGDCWVKWLTNIQVLDREFDGFFMKTAYRHPGKGVPPGTAVDPAQMKPVESVRVKSVIATPRENMVVGSGSTRIAGAAWSGETPLKQVEVSTDGGRSWQAARFTSSNGRWGWQTWDFTWNAKPGSYRLQARATDSSGYMQPMEQEWNPSGYLHNVIHSVKVEVVPMDAAGYRASCLGCHDESMIRGQRLTRAQWEKEVDKMIRWGANVPPDQKALIIDYLSMRFKP
ncbi:MAG: molybdopterin-dependent oxidoreductase [Bryobacter sp.]|nr:molybdopterin-dependent oxidoreductase [Bryobacter sp.]